MIFFKINSKTLTKNPSSISHSITKIQNQDRTMDGTMVVDIIAIKNVVNIEWKLLDKEDMSKLKSEIESGNFVTIDFWDSETETNETMKNIVATTTSFTFSPYYDYTTDSIRWKDVKISFTER